MHIGEIYVPAITRFDEVQSQKLIQFRALGLNQPVVVSFPSNVREVELEAILYPTSGKTARDYKEDLLTVLRDASYNKISYANRDGYLAVSDIEFRETGNIIVSRIKGMFLPSHLYRTILKAYPVADEGYSTDYCYIPLPVGAKYIGTEPTITRTTSDGTITLVKSQTARYELDGEEVNVGEVKIFDGSDRVYSTSHNFSGNPAIENGIYKLGVGSLSSDTIAGYVYDGAWTSLSHDIHLEGAYSSPEIISFSPDYAELNITVSGNVRTIKMWRGKPLAYISYAKHVYPYHRFGYRGQGYLEDAELMPEAFKTTSWAAFFDPSSSEIQIFVRGGEASLQWANSTEGKWRAVWQWNSPCYFGAFVPESYNTSDLFTEAESTSCSGTATGFISDNPSYSNSQGISLRNNGEYWQWNWGTLSSLKKGTWKAIFRLSGETGSECVISVENTTDATTVSSSTVNPSTDLGYHYLDVQFDDGDVNDTIVIRTTSTTDYDVNIDYFVMVPLLVGGDGFEDIVNQAHVDPRIRRGVEER
jgi:hypothetical protein